jgi:hypothetical protein
MLIHKEQRVYRQNVDKYTGAESNSSFKQSQRVLKTIWYFIGIPVYSTTEILPTTD